MSAGKLKRILLASDVYPPYVSGVSGYTQDLEKAFSKRGFAVKVVVPKYQPLNSNNLIVIPAINVPFYPTLKTGIPYAFVLRQKIKAFNPDIIHLQTQGLVGLQVADIARQLKKPLVATFHTYFLYENNFRELGLEFFFPVFNKIVWRYNKWFFNRVDGLISPSRNLVNYLKKMGIKVPITYLPNPLSLKNSHLTKPPLALVKKKYGLAKQNLLYTGRLSGEKNLENLLEAFSLVNARKTNTKLVLVGAGPALKCLKKLVKKLALTKKVIFAGEMKREDLLGSGLFQAADLFVTASESENQPLSVIEAMFFGLPVVAVAAMGMNELVTDNGLLSPPGNIRQLADNILYLLNREKLRRKMAKNSQKNARQYDIELITPKLLAYYQTFL